jgi:phage baseplate assembly protein W
MKIPRYRAWQFLYPGVDASEDEAGLTVSHTGGIAMAEGEAAVRQAILLLLSTVPGERVMRPEYGCDLRKLIFAPNNETTAGLAIHYVRQALNRWEPRIQVLKVNAARNETDPGRLDVILDYRVRTSKRSQTLVYPVSLSGE